MATDEIEPELPRPRPSSEPSPLPDSSDPIDIALTAVNAAAPPDGPAAMLLLKQGGLIDEQRRLISVQIAGERMGVALKVLTGLGGLVIALAIGSMVWSASHERGLVIEPFSVPPDLAQRGVTGQVIASRLLDRLSEMGEQTNSSRAASSYANNWDGDIKVQIPQTGVSVGELRRTLVDWLGHQTRIGGELYRTPQGLTLSARTGSAAAVAQSGASEDELDRMIQAAAESVYATTQPYRYGIYLQRSGDAESVRRAKEVFQRLTRSADELERMWAYSGLTFLLNLEGDFRGGIRAADAALAIAPTFFLARINRALSSKMLGHDEAVLRDRREADSHLRSDGPRYVSVNELGLNEPGTAADVAVATGDYQSALPDYRKAMAVDSGYFFNMIEAQLRLHEVGALRDHLALIGQTPPEAAPRVWARKAAELAIMAAAIAFEREDWVNAHALASGIDPTHLPAGRKAEIGLRAAPIAAIALAKSGDVEGAQRLIATTPLDCYRCVWARGVVDALAGDASGSDRWFAEAVRQGPSLPFAHAEWGRAKLARGDVDGAIVEFTKAHKKGPRWADPQKYWGDALVAQGNAQAALGKYAAASERAPRWGALHLAWGLALRRTGNEASAQEKFAAALQMDLTTSDQALTSAEIIAVGAPPVIAN